MGRWRLDGAFEGVWCRVVPRAKSEVAMGGRLNHFVEGLEIGTWQKGRERG